MNAVVYIQKINKIDRFELGHCTVLLYSTNLIQSSKLSLWLLELMEKYQVRSKIINKSHQSSQIIWI